LLRVQRCNGSDHRIELMVIQAIVALNAQRSA
jgi:hypothetical protein